MRIAIALLLAFGLTLISCYKQKDQIVSHNLNGHWYSIYGDSLKYYGEAVFDNGKACFYSDDFGFQQRGYTLENDSILKIYNRETLDQERIIEMPDSITVYQKVLLGNGLKQISFHRIEESDLVKSKVVSGDSMELNKFFEGFRRRKAKQKTD